MTTYKILVLGSRLRLLQCHLSLDPAVPFDSNKVMKHIGALVRAWPGRCEGLSRRIFDADSYPFAALCSTRGLSRGIWLPDIIHVEGSAPLIHSHCGYWASRAERCLPGIVAGWQHANTHGEPATALTATELTGSRQRNSLMARSIYYIGLLLSE